jgi:hypothetical protein
MPSSGEERHGLYALLFLEFIVGVEEPKRFFSYLLYPLLFYCRVPIFMGYDLMVILAATFINPRNNKKHDRLLEVTNRICNFFEKERFIT